MHDILIFLFFGFGIKSMIKSGFKGKNDLYSWEFKFSSDSNQISNKIGVFICLQVEIN